jgi:hypothetical protein
MCFGLGTASALSIDTVCSIRGRPVTISIMCDIPRRSGTVITVGSIASVLVPGKSDSSSRRAARLAICVGSSGRWCLCFRFTICLRSLGRRHAWGRRWRVWVHSLATFEAATTFTDIPSPLLRSDRAFLLLAASARCAACCSFCLSRISLSRLVLEGGARREVWFEPRCVVDPLFAASPEVGSGDSLCLDTVEDELEPVRRRFVFLFWLAWVSKMSSFLLKLHTLPILLGDV